MNYEAIVVGCGPAGLSAGIYLGRARIKTLIVGRIKGSQLIRAHKIENYFGFPEGITGKELLKKGLNQARKFGVKIIEKEIVNAKQQGNLFTMKLEDMSTHRAKSLILATGTPIKLLGILNEEELTGKGVHYCVECDGAFYQNKKVAVIGHGNHGAENALDLHIYTKDVALISNGQKFEFSKELGKELKKHNIRLIDKKITEFNGKKFLEYLVTGDKEKLSFDGIFMACGEASALDFASELGIMIKDNVVQVDSNNMTNVNGIFAAGNCAGKCRQIAKNVGDGCNAALGAIKYLKKKKVYFDYSS